MDIRYGSILEVSGITSNIENEHDIILLIQDISSNDTTYPCKILDLSPFEIIHDFKDIDDFIKDKNIDIIRKIGECNLYAKNRI